LKHWSGLWENHWNCVECDQSWFLSVDLSLDRDRQRLDTFNSVITKHCMTFNHSIVHREKEIKFSQRIG